MIPRNSTPTSAQPLPIFFFFSQSQPRLLCGRSLSVNNTLHFRRPVLRSINSYLREEVLQCTRAPSVPVGNSQ